MSEAEQPETSRVRGTLSKNAQLAAELQAMAAETVEPASRLRSTVVNREAGAVESFGEGSTVVQRDTGNRWEISRIADRERDGKTMVNLTNVDSPGATLTLAFDDLQEKLGTDGSPWSRG